MKEAEIRYFSLIGGPLGLWHRHRVSYNRLWVSEGPLTGIKSMSFDDLKFFDSRRGGKDRTAYYEKYESPGSTEFPDTIRLETLGRKERAQASGGLLRPAQGVAGFGTVPISETTCKSFLLFKESSKFEAWEARRVR